MNAPFIENHAKFLFFTGKGGVGKTSMACATGVALADAGKRVLLISTDPASNLDEVLETDLANTPLPVEGVPNLYAMNIDPAAAAFEYRERIVGPYRGVLPEAAVKSIEEQLSGACTVEIATFNEFTKIIGDGTMMEDYDHVILDTAPTGHTLRLLSLPAAWNDFIATNADGSSCLGPLSGLKDQRATYERAVAALVDPKTTLLVLVARAERAALKEAARAGLELASLGIRNQQLIVNGVFVASQCNDAVALSLERRAISALEEMPDSLKEIPRHEIAFHPRGFVGVKSLRTAFEEHQLTFTQELPAPSPLAIKASSLATLVDGIETNGRGVIMTMGKGGVGKTTMAAAIAVELANRGYEVLLSTTDPAAHVSDAVGTSLPNLRVSRIDPAAETRAYVQHVLATAGAKMDAAAYELLQEELRSPCTEEIAVFHAFARTIAEGANGFVVLDTAPTGHTLLLLDATEAYHREVLRSTSELPEAVRELLPRLRNPDYTKIVLVTLPEATPVHEAAQLQLDLRRAGIEPYAWIINQSFTASQSIEPALRLRAKIETSYISEVAGNLSKSTVLVPWMDGELQGQSGLSRMVAA